MSTKKNPVETHSSLFRKTDGGVPELLEQQNSEASKHSDINLFKHPLGVKRIKRTFHLEPDVVLLLSEVQVAEQRRTGQKPELSELVSQAIRQFGEQHSPDSQTSRLLDRQPLRGLYVKTGE